MVTYPQLRGTDPLSWSVVAEVMRRFAEAIAVRADQIGELIDSLGAQWTGVAAAAALVRLSAVRTDLLAAFPGIVAIDQTLTELSTAIAEARNGLAAASDPRPGSVVRVAADGTVQFVPIDGPPDQFDIQDLLSTQAALDRALDAADRADRDACVRLRAIGFDVDTSQPAPPGPPPGAGAASVAAWWRGLAPAQQRFIVVVEPASVAGLDGIPADVRDQASRLLLHRQAVQLRDEDSLVRAGAHPDAAVLADIDGRIDGVQALEDRLDDTGPVRAYLLGIDAPDDRAILAIGNPDDATDTLTFVSGVGSGVHRVRDTMAAIDNIEQVSTALPTTGSWTPAGTGNLVTIGWMDYDAPGNLHDATGSQPALDAGAPLSRFESGLRATATGDVHESVLGYSYGSVVVGAAAHAGGLHADDVILVGSPGTGVRHAGDLGVPAADVWATAARNDLVPRLARPTAIVTDAISLLLGKPADQSWFGPNPTSPGFGAHVFTSAHGSLAHPVEAHTSYFDLGNPALTNIARLAVGDDPDVS